MKKKSDGDMEGKVPLSAWVEMKTRATHLFYMSPL